MNQRTCLLCKHFYFEPEEPGYSELTPGCEMKIGCYKEYWQFNPQDEEQVYRIKMLTARSCKDYEKTDKI